MEKLSNYIQMEGELFRNIQERRIFDDSETFVDSYYKDGEYIIQTGFGRTNGVAIAFLENHLYGENSGKLDTDEL